MKALRILLCIMLFASITGYAADAKVKKRVDVDTVDVPEKIVIQPTPAEIHEDAPIGQKCESCHGPNSLDAETKPLNHFLTTRDCGVCHFNKSWVPLRIYTHKSARYKPVAGGDPTDCASCHVSNNEFQAQEPN